MRLSQLEEKKETKENFQELKKRFDIFSQIETITTLREVFLPRIEEFTNLVDKLEESHA